MQQAVQPETAEEAAEAVGVGVGVVAAVMAIFVAGMLAGRTVHRSCTSVQLLVVRSTPQESCKYSTRPGEWAPRWLWGQPNVSLLRKRKAAVPKPAVLVHRIGVGTAKSGCRNLHHAVASCKVGIHLCLLEIILRYGRYALRSVGIFSCSSRRLLVGVALAHVVSQVEKQLSFDW